MNSLECGDFVNLTASAQVKSGPGRLLGIFVASAASTPTIKVWAQTSEAAPVLVNTFTPEGATYYRMPARFSSGLYITISGTVDCTVFYV